MTSRADMTAMMMLTAEDPTVGAADAWDKTRTSLWQEPSFAKDRAGQRSTLGPVPASPRQVTSHRTRRAGSEGGGATANGGPSERRTL